MDGSRCTGGATKRVYDSSKDESKGDDPGVSRPRKMVKSCPEGRGGVRESTVEPSKRISDEMNKSRTVRESRLTFEVPPIDGTSDGMGVNRVPWVSPTRYVCTGYVFRCPGGPRPSSSGGAVVTRGTTPSRVPTCT